jgi:hypothetical protein
VQRPILLCGLAVGAFVLTFAFSSRHDGSRRFDAAPSTPAAAQPPGAVTTPTDMVAPAAAALNPNPAIAPPVPEQSEPYEAPPRRDRDRTGERGSRSR